MGQAVRTEKAAADALERRVLEIVQALVIELGGHPRGPVTPRASLDRDLGIGSLERVELLLRLEQEFGVRLPVAVMGEAESPRDLVRAIRVAAPVQPEPAPETRLPIGPGVAAPADARTLVEVLRWHADTHPDRVHVFLREEDGTETPISYGALRERAVALAAGLREHRFGEGQSIALMLRTEPAFFDAFFGTLLAGCIPVPIYPPFRLDRLEEYAARQVGILTNAEARLLVTFGARHPRRPAATRSRAVAPRRHYLRAPLASGVSSPGVPPGERGSRPHPIHFGKHGGAEGRAPLARKRAGEHPRDRRGDRHRPQDVAVSWLPLYQIWG